MFLEDKVFGVSVRVGSFKEMSMVADRLYMAVVGKVEKTLGCREDG